MTRSGFCLIPFFVCLQPFSWIVMFPFRLWFWNRLVLILLLVSVRLFHFFIFFVFDLTLVFTCVSWFFSRLGLVIVWLQWNWSLFAWYYTSSALLISYGYLFCHFSSSVVVLLRFMSGFIIFNRSTNISPIFYFCFAHSSFALRSLFPAISLWSHFLPALLGPSLSRLSIRMLDAWPGESYWLERGHWRSHWSAKMRPGSEPLCSRSEGDGKSGKTCLRTDYRQFLCETDNFTF
jgi:hypothetical protein